MSRAVKKTTTLLPETTKQERRDMVEQVIHAIEEGHVDPRKIHLQIKCMEDLIKMLTENTRYRESLIRESSKYGKEHLYQNATFEVREAGVKYDYASCGDPLIDDLLQQQAELSAQIKQRQEYLKRLPQSGAEYVDPDTAEIFWLYPPVKSSVTTVAVSLK